ncbi:MAG TPA: GNAT family N-acetyltransferase [Thermoplasmata archaeon]|nr:GNAT family N-acetyltransferase [Thermoplasmata archaeon]
MGELVPFPRDRATVLRFAREALAARRVVEGDTEPQYSMAEELLQSAAPPGRLYRSEGRPRGLVLWHPTSPVGVGLSLVHIDSSEGRAELYRDLLLRAEELLGKVPFVSGPLAGLSVEGESALMRSLGFAPFGRLEMRSPLGRLDPVPNEPRGVSVREARGSDEKELARLHAAAYGNHFDRYLFLSDLDPVRDAELYMHDIVAGSHGEFLGGASSVVEEEGSLIGACLVVRRPYGPLIVDVMVDPVRQGRGIGRQALLRTLSRLRAQGETTAVLNVTVGNTPALRLYERAGFVRTIGPSREWFRSGLVPTGPGEGYASPTVPRTVGPGSGAE